MGLWWESPSACYINMRGGARGELRPYMTQGEALAATSSRPNSEALATRVVLAYPCMVFYPCTCGLHRGAATVAATLIGYDNIKVAAETTTRRMRSWLTTSSILTRDYVRSLLQLFFHYSMRLVVTIHDLLLTSIIGWHGRSTASVAYLLPYTGIRAILCSSWSGSCAMVICDGY
jgi:hypothetical protein